MFQSSVLHHLKNLDFRFVFIGPGFLTKQATGTFHDMHIWSLMTRKRLLRYPARGCSSEILAHILQAMLFVGSFQRSFRPKVIPR
jgi:hypothetical protein